MFNDSFWMSRSVSGPIVLVVNMVSKTEMTSWLFT